MARDGPVVDGPGVHDGVRPLSDDTRREEDRSGDDSSYHLEYKDGEPTLMDGGPVFVTDMEPKELAESRTRTVAPELAESRTRTVAPELAKGGGGLAVGLLVLLGVIPFLVI